MNFNEFHICANEEEKVLAIYLKEGKLNQLPSKERRKVIVLMHISKKFNKKRDYSEKEVNEILKDIYEDFAIIRRYLIDYKFLKRNKDGTRYWLNQSTS